MSKPENKAQNATNPQPTKPEHPKPTENHGQGHTKTTSHGSGKEKNNVIVLPGMCMSEGCKKKSEKANFCMEHFDWFKEGLITKEGRRPTDFEKKHFDYTRRKRPAA